MGKPYWEDYYFLRKKKAKNKCLTLSLGDLYTFYQYVKFWSMLKLLLL